MPTINTEQSPFHTPQPAAPGPAPADGLFQMLLGTLAERPASAQAPASERATDRTRSRKELQFAHDVAASRDLPASWSLVPSRDATSQAVERLRARGEPAHDAGEVTTPERRTPERARAGSRGEGRTESFQPPVPPKGEVGGERVASTLPESAPAMKQGAEATTSGAARTPPVVPVGAPGPQASPASRLPATGAQVARVDVAGPRATPQPGATVVRGAAGTQGVSTSRTPMRTPAPPPQPPAKPEPLPQVVRGLALALRQGGGTVSMKMHPENLGTVTVRLRVDGGEVRARLETSEESARRLLLDSTDELRAALEARGLRVERIEIGGAEDRPADQRQPGADRPHDRPNDDAGGARRHENPEPEGVETPIVLATSGPVLTLDHAGRVRLEAIA
jgi:flagellar hook-length control protein FliK